MDVVKERNYDFRKRMLEVHKPGRRDFHVLPSENEIQVDETWEIVLPEDTARVLKIAANDLQDYFAVSMKVFLKLRITDNIATEIASLSRKIILTNKRLSPVSGLQRVHSSSDDFNNTNGFVPGFSRFHRILIPVTRLIISEKASHFGMIA
jgi:hypothetical protein